MSALTDDLRLQAEQHPLDARLEMFTVAADRLDEMERLLNAVQSTEFGGVNCLDIHEQGNWFDVRDAIIDRCN